MNTNLIAVIKRIIAAQGESILGDPARLKSFIHSEAAGIPPESRLAFGRCIEQGYYRVLKQAPEKAERDRIKPQIAKQMHSICKLDIKHCREAIDTLEAVLYGQAPAPARFPGRSIKKAAAFSAAAAAVIAFVIFTALHSGVQVFEPIVEFNGEAYPSKIITVAAADAMLGSGPRMIENDSYIGDALGDLGVKIRLGLPDKILRVEIEGDKFIKKSSIEAEINSKKSVEIFPRINYNYPELEKIEEPYIETVTFKLYVNDKLKKETAKTVPFHSINDEPVWDASRSGNKTLSNYHFVVVVREMERIEQELERNRREIEQSETARREAAERTNRAPTPVRDPYNDKRIRNAIAKVHANLRDVDGDGLTNCVDYSNLFYYYSPFKYNDVVVNYNPKGPQGGMNHMFNVVQIDGQFVYIEPQADADRPYNLQEYWGARYNPNYNQIHKTTWLYLPRGQQGTEE